MPDPKVIGNADAGLIVQLMTDMQNAQTRQADQHAQQTAGLVLQLETLRGEIKAIKQQNTTL